MILCIHVISLKKTIKNHDIYSRNDLYVCISYGKTMKRTTTIWNTDIPIWNEWIIFEETDVDVLHISIHEANFTYDVCLHKYDYKINKDVMIQDATGICEIQIIKFNPNTIKNIEDECTQQKYNISILNEKLTSSLADRSNLIEKLRDMNSLNNELTKKNMIYQETLHNIWKNLNQINYIDPLDNV